MQYIYDIQYENAKIIRDFDKKSVYNGVEYKFYGRGIWKCNDDFTRKNAII
jgi:hypothetical protein